MVCLNQVEDTNYKQSRPPPHGNNNDRDHSWTYLFNGKSTWGFGMATKISSVDTILLFLLSPDSQSFCWKSHITCTDLINGYSDGS